MLETILIFAVMAVFLLFTGIVMPSGEWRKSNLSSVSLPQLSPRGFGKDKLLESMARESITSPWMARSAIGFSAS